MSDEILDSGLLEDKEDVPVRYAGFGIRLGAALIDFLVFLPIVGLTFWNTLDLKILSLEIVLALIGLLYKNSAKTLRDFIIEH